MVMTDSPMKNSHPVPWEAPWLPVSAQVDCVVTGLFKARPGGYKAMGTGCQGKKGAGNYRAQTKDCEHLPLAPIQLETKILGGGGRRRKCSGPHSLGTMVPLRKGEQVQIFSWENYLSLTK